MIIASSMGNLPAFKALLSKGMELDHQDCTGNTPLIYAARYARLDLAQYLLRHGYKRQSLITAETVGQSRHQRGW